MAENNSELIRFRLESGNHAHSLIGHITRYISAITGLNLVQDQSGSDLASIVDPGLIDKIASKIAFKSVLGPYGDGATTLSADDMTLSEAIAAFVRCLSTAGLTRKNDAPITLWPKPFKFGLIVTHDIDIARRSIPGGARIWLQNSLPGGFRAVMDSLASSIGFRNNPYDCIPDWLMLENKLGIRSTYFVFAGERQDERDPKYKLDILSKRMNEIISGGRDIGLHTSIGSYQGNRIGEAKSSLDKICDTKIKGLRPHYLSGSFPQYWHKAISDGFEYSSSLGFDDRIGFWNGVDLPIFPYDKDNDQPIDLLEIPIGIMDCGLIMDQVADSDAVFDRAKQLISRAARSGALLVLDWHQRTFYNRDYPGWTDLFLKVIDYAKESGAHVTNMNDIATEMKSRFQGRP